MKRRFFYLKVIFFIYFPYIAFSNGNIGNKFINISGFSSHNSINFNNPGLIPIHKDNIINLNISPGLFNMNELQQNEIYSKFKVFNNFYLNLGFSGINNSLFNDNSIQGGFAYKFSPILQLGINLNYNIFTVKDFSTINSLSVDLGGLVRLDDNLYAAFVLENLNRASRVSNDDNPEQIASFGLAYKLNQSFILEATSIINIAKSNSFSISSKYNIEDLISIRIAFLTEPQTFVIGANYNLFDDWFINYDINKNNILGYTHLIGLSILW